MKNILVTGHTGYLGSALVKKLSQFSDYNVLLFNGDVSKCEDWNKNFNTEIDTVFHLAGLEVVNGIQSKKDIIREWEVNSLSLLHLANLCKNSNSKIVFVSSTAIFNNNIAYCFRTIFA